MPIIVLTVLVQILCIYHVVSTGRDKYWIGLILMAPGIGSLIYVLTQVLPDAGKSRTATNLKEGAIKAIDPNRELREALEAFDLVESVDNHIRLADALYDLERYEEAEPHLKICLQGAHKHDPHMLLRLASIRLELGDPTTALTLLDQLQQNNKGFNSQNGHMLYSRALEASGNTEEALSSFANLVEYATGEEARVRYGFLLQNAGQNPEAALIFEEVIKRVGRGTKFYRRAQQHWADRAKLGLAGQRPPSLE
ncbi:MAG: hypothetical protein COB37_09005 [Kordiimonadales bacterium]|nr:MAG: hypothetical protein COB37_09005 [Kordiimonadales bacterium]